MEVFIFWVAFSIIIGVLANKRGRNGVLWVIISALISPIISGIILFILPNLKKEEEEDKQRELELEEAKRISVKEFIASIEKVWQLNNKNILSDSEYISRKTKIIENLKDKRMLESPDDFLAELAPLLENDIIENEELSKIKGIVYE